MFILRWIVLTGLGDHADTMSTSNPVVARKSILIFCLKVVDSNLIHIPRIMEEAVINTENYNRYLSQISTAFNDHIFQLVLMKSAPRKQWQEVLEMKFAWVAIFANETDIDTEGRCSSY